MTDSSDDLRILYEMATEIEEHGFVGIPGSLRHYLKTKRGKHIGQIFELSARMALVHKRQLSEAMAEWKKQVDALRTENQLLTDALLKDRKAP